MSGKTILFFLGWGLGILAGKFFVYSQFLELGFISSILLLLTPLVFYFASFGAVIISDAKLFFQQLITQRSFIQALAALGKDPPGFYLFFVTSFLLLFSHGLLVAFFSYQGFFPLGRVLLVEGTFVLIMTLWPRKRVHVMIDDAESDYPPFVP